MVLNVHRTTRLIRDGEMEGGWGGGMEVLMVEVLFTSTETVGLLGTGAQDGHLDFHAAPEL